MKLWKTPVGLARPIVPTVNPQVTHRGRGAFCDLDFTKISKDKELKKDKETGTGDQGKSIKDEKLSGHDVDDKAIVEEKGEKLLAISEPHEQHLDAEENEFKVDTVDERTLNDDNEESRDKIKVDSGVDIDNGETEVNDKHNVDDEPISNSNAFNSVQLNETDIIEEKGIRDENSVKIGNISPETKVERDVLSNRDDNDTVSVATTDNKSDVKAVDRVEETLTDVNSGSKDTPANSSVMDTQNEQEILSEAKVNLEGESDKENEASEYPKQDEDDILKSAYDNPIYDTV